MNSAIDINANEQQKSPVEQFLAEKEILAKTKLKELLINISASVRKRKKAGNFYVCDVNVVRDLIKPFDVAWGAGESPYENISYNVLRSIHCAKYSDFTDKMKRLLPEVVIEALAFNHKSLKEYLGESDYEEVVKALNAPFPEEIKEWLAEKLPYPFFKTFAVVASTAFVVSAIVSSIFLWALYSADLKPRQSDISDIGVLDVGSLPIIPHSDEPMQFRIIPERELTQQKAGIEDKRLFESSEDMYRKEIKDILKPQDSAHDENQKK
jgi:hypothetical protein